MSVQTAAQVLDCTTSGSVLFVALELGEAKWKCAFSVGFGQKPRHRTVVAGAGWGLLSEIRSAKRRFALPEDAPVVCCYEAGRDGFWLHRFLVAQGVQNVLVDSSSIEVKRRQRRVKSDRLDADKLLTMLMRYHLGEKKVWSVVHVPNPADEDQRHLQRELMTLTKERTRQINRIRGLLVTQGIRLPRVKKTFVEELEQMRLWDDSPLGAALRGRLKRVFEHLVIIEQQLRAIERERLELLGKSRAESAEKSRRLMQLRGIGINSAWLYSTELFSWREIRNRRELASLTGLTPSPYHSGESQREQGISKAGNRWIRGIAIEIAWHWLRCQPASELSLWYQQRFGGGSKRQRKIGIVALARKLLIALWRFLETGEIPQGAQLMDWQSKLRCRGGRLAVPVP